MIFRPILIILFAFVTLTGCQKKHSSADPCEGLLNESPPTNISVKFIDKVTGENLIISENLQVSDITVTNTLTGKPFTNWDLVKADTASPLNGTLRFSIFQESPGQYPYQIKLGDLRMATLSYTVSKVATNNPCKPEAFPISDIKITDHAFSLLSYDGRVYPNVLVLEL